ncbi:MAG: hypothetical protein LBG07_09610, partial [Treponema sp.]|nr:hypothetical protein [Treponema sp.]
GKPQHRCHFACIDAGELPRLIPPASLDSIITDPPWGLYQKSGPGTETAEKNRKGTKGGRTGEAGGPRLPPGELYSQSLAVFSGLLKPGAPAVVLCGRGEELKGAAEKNRFSIEKNIPILLSGRKAAVYVLRSPE